MHKSLFCLAISITAIKTFDPEEQQRRKHTFFSLALVQQELWGDDTRGLYSLR